MLRRQSVLETGYAHHAFEVADAFDQLREVQAVAYTPHQLYHADAAIALIDADLVDAGVGHGNAGGKLGDDAALVFQLDAQLDGKFAADILVPRQVQRLLAVVAQFSQIAAVFLVND